MRVQEYFNKSTLILNLVNLVPRWHQLFRNYVTHFMIKPIRW